MLLGDHGAEVIKVESPGGDPVREQPGFDRLAPREAERRARRRRGRRPGHRPSTSPAPPTSSCTRARRRTVTRLGLTDDVAARRPSTPGRRLDHRVRHRGRRVRARRGRRAGAGARGHAVRATRAARRTDLPPLAAPELRRRAARRRGHQRRAASREITGEGQLVETSLVQGALVWMTQLWRHATTPTPPLYEMWQFKDLVPTPCFEAGDGRWFHAMTNGLPIALAHLGRDPSELDLRVMISRRPPVARALLRRRTRRCSAQRPRDEWVELMQRNDVNCQPIEPAEPVFEHPQLLHTGGGDDRRRPGRRARHPARPHLRRSRDHENEAPAPPPSVGEHTATCAAPRSHRPRPGAAASAPRALDARARRRAGARFRHRDRRAVRRDDPRRPRGRRDQDRSRDGGDHRAPGHRRRRDLGVVEPWEAQHRRRPQVAGRAGDRPPADLRLPT